jgi:hypothetical protein
MKICDLLEHGCVQMSRNVEKITEEVTLENNADLYKSCDLNDSANINAYTYTHQLLRT